MWNERLEARALRMRQRQQEILESLAKVAIAPPAPVQHHAQGGQLAVLARRWESMRKQGDGHRYATTTAIVPFERKPLGRNKGNYRIEAREGNYPVCPRCPGAQQSNTIRAGLARGIQRYRCVLCRRTFSGGSIVFNVQPRDYRLICHHCGSDDTARLGSGIHNKRKTGQRGRCRRCGLKFVQGGTADLEKYHLLLASRIADMKLPEDVEMEVFQQAAVDVLQGKGYCWTVELKKQKAWKALRGEWNQRGSNHPVFTIHA